MLSKSYFTETTSFDKYRLSEQIQNEISSYRANKTSSFREDLLLHIPKSVLELLRIRGLSAKLIALLWKERGFTKISEIKQACGNNELIRIKGIGEAKQKSVLKQIRFIETTFSKLRFDEAFEEANTLKAFLEQDFDKVQLSGQVYAGATTVDKIILEVYGQASLFECMKAYEAVQIRIQESSPFVFRGRLKQSQLPIEIHEYKDLSSLYKYTFVHSMSDIHLVAWNQKKGFSLAETTLNLDSEEDIYKSFKMPYLIPERRHISDLEDKKTNYIQGKRP